MSKILAQQQMDAKKCVQVGQFIRVHLLIGSWAGRLRLSMSARRSGRARPSRRGCLWVIRLGRFESLPDGRHEVLAVGLASSIHS